MAEEAPRLTPLQQRVISLNRLNYGHEDLLMIECEAVLRGIVRQVWWSQRRELFIKADGERLLWTRVAF